MRNNYKIRVWSFRPRRIDDDMYSCILFSKITSIRGYTRFQLFAFKSSNLERIELICRKANVPETYKDVIRSAGEPNKTVTDNVSVLTGLR